MREFDKRNSLFEAGGDVSVKENGEEQNSFQEQENQADGQGSEKIYAKKEMPKEKIKFSKIFEILFKGWKKDLKKVQTLLVVFFYLALIFGGISIFYGSFLGWKTNIFLSKVNYKRYDHIAPNLSFKYPNYFVIDNGEGKNYGSNYLAGLKLSTDPRTGCDIRLSSAGVNFNKSDAEIRDALVSEISKTAKDFNLVSSKRTKINGENAFSLEFSFTDPINSRVHLNQVITGHDKNFYMIICGTGDYQYKFFESDFDSFVDSLRWKSSLQS